MTRIEGDARLIASDNPFVLPGADNEAFAAEVVVRPEFTWTPGPATTAEVTGNVAYRRYSRRYGDFLTAKIEAAASHRDSEYLTIGTNLSFSRDLPADAMTETIDFSIDPRSMRQRLAANGSIDWSPDARTTVNGVAGWERLRYPGSALLSAANAYHVDLAAIRRLSPQTSAGIRASFTHTDIIGIASLRAYSVYATVSHRIGTVLDASADLGVEWSGYNLPGNRRARLSGRANLCYRPSPYDLCLTAARQSEVSGFGGLQSELHLGVNASRRVGTRGRISALSEYRRADLGLIDSQTSAMRVGIAYRHRLTEQLSLTGEADYLARKFMTGNRNKAVVIRVGVTFGRER